MKWRTNKKHGDSRIVHRFAWKPTPIDSGETVFFERYWCEEIWQEPIMHNGILHKGVWFRKRSWS